MDFNKCFFAGRLTREPKTSYLPSQTSVCEFSIAVNKKWKSKSGEKKEEVMFIDAIAFSRTGENIQKFFHKGDPIFLEASLQLDTWATQDGQRRSKHKILVQNFQFLPSGEKREDPVVGNKNPDWVGENPATPTDDVPF